MDNQVENEANNTPNKKRLPNFSTEEKVILIEIIESVKDVIENKKTDAVTVKQKENCWVNISRQFNSRCILANRNVLSLKSCWDNLKKKTRKHYADIRKEVFATGGGKTIIEHDPLCKRVKGIIEPSVESLSNPFDSDNADIAANVYDPTDNSEECYEVEALDETVLSMNWNDWTPAMLKSKKSKELENPVHNKELLESDNIVSNNDQNMANPTDSTVNTKSKRRNRVRPFISAGRRNQCFYDLAQSKSEVVQLMKDDLRAKSVIEMKILQTQLEKEQLQVELLKKQLRSYDT